MKTASKSQLEVEIEMKPLSINVAWQGRRFRTPEYRGYVAEALLLLPEKEKIGGEVEVWLEFSLKQLFRGDVDNLIKPILDIVVKRGYITDDRYIVVLHAVKKKAKANKIKIVIKQLTKKR